MKDKGIKTGKRSDNKDMTKEPSKTSVKFLRIVWCDNANIIRAKAVRMTSNKLSNYYVGISPAQQAIPVVYDEVVPETGLTPVGEIQLTADLSSFKRIPYAPGHSRVMGDMKREGKTWECCPRGFLKKQETEAAQLGLDIKCAFENEFYLLKDVEGEIDPADSTVFASTYSMDLHNEVIMDIVRCLTLQDMVVEQYYPESGPGQQEITVKYAPALRSATNQIVFRETIRAVAAKHGLKSSFLPKIFSDKAGNGCHLHLSLWKDGKNILSDLNNTYGLSETATQFIAGILENLSALMAITTPTTNSYRRIQPFSWCGAYNCWGFNNREAAVRVIYEPDGKIEHFEFKVMDPSSNPYLALGAVMAAGIQGIRGGLDLNEPVQSDPGHLSSRDRNEQGIKPLPSSLGVALSNLEKNKMLSRAMGDELFQAYLAVKKEEWKLLRDFSLKEEVELLLEKY